MTLKVLHVIPSVSAVDGGPSRAIEFMEQGLQSAGVSVTTLTTDYRLDANAGRSLSPAERVHCALISVPYKIAPGMVSVLAKRLSSFDVVHVHALFSFAPTVAAWAARLAGVPYVIRPLGTLSEYGLEKRRRLLKGISVRWIESENLRNASAVHFTTEEERHEAEKQGYRCRGVVIPIGVPRPAMSNVRPLMHPALSGRSVILFLSRIDPKKNLEALIDAFARSLQLRATATLVIAGSGEAGYVASLQARAKRAGIADHVVWLGHVEGSQKAMAMASATLFCLPSYSENFGIAAVEALFAGLPCILGEGVAISKEVAASGAGIAVKPDSAAVGRALDELIADPVRLRRMGQNAQALADREYSLETMTRLLIDLYKDIRRRPAAGATGRARPVAGAN